METKRGRVVGIGGVFFKSPDAPALNAWYADKLGIEVSPYGASFPWRTADDPSVERQTAWSVFPSTSKYMDPPFMINYIVENLDALLEDLAAKGVTIDPKRGDESYGRFAWVYDADGNKIELWEPSATA